MGVCRWVPTPDWSEKPAEALRQAQCDRAAFGFYGGFAAKSGTNTDSKI